MPERAKVVTTDEEIDEAIERARRFEKYDRRLVTANYSATTDSLRMTLNDGVTCIIPRALIQGLEGAKESHLKKMQILGNGTGLLWPILDVAHYVPGLLQGVYGTEKWMTALYKHRKKLKLVGRLPFGKKS